MPPRRAGHPSPLLCPVRKRDSSKAAVKYQTDVMALVERVKAAVHCSHLWVLLAGTPPPGGGMDGALPPLTWARVYRTFSMKGHTKRRPPALRAEGCPRTQWGKPFLHSRGRTEPVGRRWPPSNTFPFPNQCLIMSSCPEACPPFILIRSEFIFSEP